MQVAVNFTLSMSGLATKKLLTLKVMKPMGLPHFWHLNGLDSLIQASPLTL